jgi:hypothetical protein
MQTLKEKCIALNIPYLKPKRDVKTRWNSTHEMLNRALNLKTAFNVLFDLNNDLKDYKIDEISWSLFEKIHDFLKIFSEATSLLSGSTYSTLCTNIPIVEMLIKHLNLHKHNENLIVKECAEKILHKLKKCENNICNELSFICLILDPWLKLNYIDDEERKNSMKMKFKTLYEKFYLKTNNTANETYSNDKSLKSSIFKKQKTSHDFDELNRYLSSSEEHESIDPINWWKDNLIIYPNLSKMAADFLCIPSTSVPSERVFSKGGDLVTKKRNRLSKNTIKITMLLNSWSKVTKNM